MSMGDSTPPPVSTPVIVGYCRTCGKALDQLSVRQSHGTIFCEDHVPRESPGMPGSSTYNASYTASPYAGHAYATQPPPMPQAPADASVSPGLAFLLGLLPGVGAIYNGQYAKGLVHVLILGTLMTIVSNSGGGEFIFGILIPCFWVYMAFEAYHTAQKRRLGQPVEEFSGLAQPGGRASGLPIAAIFLIVFGTLFLLNNLDILELRRLVRFWPVLMIGAGLYMLWARMTRSQDGGGNPQ